MVILVSWCLSVWFGLMHEDTTQKKISFEFIRKNSNSKILISVYDMSWAPTNICRKSMKVTKYIILKFIYMWFISILHSHQRLAHIDFYISLDGFYDDHAHTTSAGIMVQFNFYADCHPGAMECRRLFLLKIAFLW